MAKVGKDKRLSYYQMTGDEAIAELRSHRYGLTAPEAKRRLQQNGANIIGATAARPVRIYPLIQPWFLAMLLAGIAGAWYLDQTLLAGALLFIALLSVGFDVWRDHHHDNLEYHLHKLLPAKATVRRNDVAQVIDAADVVLGDILLLEVGMALPADLRILETTNLLVNDDLLLGGSGHNHKFTHPLANDVPLSQRHNIALAGSQIVSGQGVGIVIATGMQTELGRILIQADATAPKGSLFHGTFYRLTRRLAWLTVILLAGAGIFLTNSTIGARDAITYGLALVVSLLPVGVVFAAIRMFAIFKSRARWSTLSVQANSVADQLGGIDTLLVDEDNFVIDSTAVATDFLIGKKRFSSSEPILTPHGKLLGETGKPLTKRTISELRLFFDAIALSTDTSLLPPDNYNQEWHVAGPVNEGALVALAAQSGVSVEEIRQQHPRLANTHFDHDRQLASSVHQYDHRQMVFVHGTGLAVLAHCKQIWDAGHTRKLTAADTARLNEYHDAQSAQGNHVVAIAYRQLAQKVDAAALTARELETELVLLGVVGVGQPVQPPAVSALSTARSLGISCSLLTNRSVHAVQGLAMQLGFDNAALIKSQETTRLSDSQLLQALASGNTIFIHLAPEQRLRLVDIAGQAGRHVAITGQRLSDLPALRHATVGLSGAQTDPLIAEESDVVLTTNDLHALIRAFGRSREISAHLRRIIHSALTDHSVQLWLVIISFVLFLTHHIPLATTAILLLLATMLQSLAFAAIGDDATNKHESPVALVPHTSVVNVILGLFGGLLVTINFVYFFVRADLSPDYIDSSSSLYLQAATLSFVTLGLIMWVNLLFSRAQHTHSLLSRQLRNATLLQVFGLYVLAVLALIYDKPIQNIVGTHTLSLTDWMCVLVVALAYFTLRFIAHTGRQHSRQAIIALHQEIHGKDSSPKI